MVKRRPHTRKRRHSLRRTRRRTQRGGAKINIKNPMPGVAEKVEKAAANKEKAAAENAAKKAAANKEKAAANKEKAAAANKEKAAEENKEKAAEVINVTPKKNNSASAGMVSATVNTELPSTLSGNGAAANTIPTIKNNKKNKKNTNQSVYIKCTKVNAPVS